LVIILYQKIKSIAVNLRNKPKHSRGKLKHSRGKLMHSRGKLMHSRGKLMHSRGKLKHSRGKLMHSRGKLMRLKSKPIHLEKKTMLFVISFCFVFQRDGYCKLRDASKVVTLIYTINIHILKYNIV
jgi:hypothetical protein